jgi:hypothetical protein
MPFISRKTSRALDDLAAVKNFIPEIQEKNGTDDKEKRVGATCDK